MYGIRIRRDAGLVCLALALLAGRASADEPRQRLEMRGGDRVEGRILAVTKNHVLMDVAGGQRFVERSQVERAVESDGTRIDLAARETEGTRDVVGLVVTQFNQEKIRVTRGDTSFEPTSISTERGITNALIRVRDELRTGPWSRAQLALPGGVQLTAQNNAVVRFGESGPSLLRGSVRMKEGDFSLEIPEGRASGHGVDILADHTRDRTQITCYLGTCRIDGADGWHLDLHRNHTVDIANGQNERAPYIAANGANSFPVDLQVAGKWIQIQPGEKVCLIVLGSADRRAPADEHREDPRPAAERPRDDPQPWNATPPSGNGVGRVVKADSPFWQTRSGQAPFKVAPEAAASTVLKANDEISTEDGHATLAFDESGFDLNTHTALVIYPEDLLVAGLFRLKRGEARATTAGKVVVAVPVGEAAIYEGTAVLMATSSSVTLCEQKGRAVLGSGKDVKVEVPTGATVTATVSEGKTKVEASGVAAFVHAANIDTSLAPRRALEVGRADDGTIQVTLWTNTRLELEGSLTARVEEPESGLVAVLSDGRRVTLEPGAVVRLKPLAPKETGPFLHDPVIDPVPRVSVDPPVPTPQDFPRLPVPERPVVPEGQHRLDRAGGPEARTLSNGAVLTLVNWGALKDRPSTNDFVEVEGPGGSPLLVGPKTRLTLRRLRGGSATVTTDDKRILTWSEGSQTSTFTYRIGADGKLTIDLAGDRSLAVDGGASFELELRADGLVHAELVQQTVYVQPGEHLSVNRAGYHTEHGDMAKVSPGSK
jgi:hypothetical protein